MADSNSKNRRPLLSIVFSFRNEEANLHELIGRVRKVMADEKESGSISGHEMIFVNDASSDRSMEILEELAKGYNDIKVVTTSRPFGTSPCALAGMEYASGDAVVYMDSDLQDPPELIPELIHAWQSGKDVDVVHTVRRSRAGEARIKLMITDFGYWILNRTTDFRLPKNAGDFKLLSRRVVNHIVAMKEKNPFLRGMVCWVGFSQVFVQYDRLARSSGRTKFPVFGRKVIFNFLDSALISFSSLPMKFALCLGAVVSLLAFVLLAYVIAMKLIQPHEAAGISAIMITTVFLGGVQLLTIGIIGLYVNSVFLDVKGRPNFIVKSTFGFQGNSGHKHH